MARTCSTPATVVDHPSCVIIGTIATAMFTLSMLLSMEAMAVAPRTWQDTVGGSARQLCVRSGVVLN